MAIESYFRFDDDKIEYNIILLAINLKSRHTDMSLSCIYQTDIWLHVHSKKLIILLGLSLVMFNSVAILHNDDGDTV